MLLAPERGPIIRKTEKNNNDIEILLINLLSPLITAYNKKENEKNINGRKKNSTIDSTGEYVEPNIALIIEFVK